jgi:hypothetical protein
MAFWSDSSTKEPLRQNRWSISFVNESLDAHQYALKSCTKPEYRIEVTEHLLINQTFRYPKNIVWQPIDAVMVSTMIGDSKTKKESLPYVLTNYLSSAGYDPMDTRQVSKENLINNLAQDGIQLIQFNEDGDLIETWVLKNPMITNVKYGSLSYENDGFVDINFTIVYDYAIYYPHDVNSGTPVNPGFPDSPPPPPRG